MTLLRLGCGVLCLGLLACGDDDAGVPTRDSGAIDAPTEQDAGEVDGGTEDAGAVDGGGVDAPPGEDAGMEDTGPSEDSGPPADGGSVYTGVVSIPCTAPGERDPFHPDACGADMNCVLGADDMTVCRASTGAAATGATCSRAEDCAGGNICINFGGEATCQQMCPDGSIGFCSGSENRCSGGIGDECVRFCQPRSEPCDIYAQDCADPEDGCNFSTDPETGARYTGCRPAGPQTLGEPCGSDPGFCARGLVCIRVDGEAACHEVCDAEDPTDICSDVGQTCSGLSTGFMVTYCRDA